MQSQPFHKDTRAIAGWLESAQATETLRPQGNGLLFTEYRRISDEELELIEMRYQQALALMSLEYLFVEGHLDC